MIDSGSGGTLANRESLIDIVDPTFGARPTKNVLTPCFTREILPVPLERTKPHAIRGVLYNIALSVSQFAPESIFNASVSSIGSRSYALFIFRFILLAFTFVCSALPRYKARPVLVINTVQYIILFLEYVYDFLRYFMHEMHH